MVVRGLLLEESISYSVTGERKKCVKLNKSGFAEQHDIDVTWRKCFSTRDPTHWWSSLMIWKLLRSKNDHLYHVLKSSEMICWFPVHFLWNQASHASHPAQLSRSSVSWQAMQWFVFVGFKWTTKLDAINSYSWQNISIVINFSVVLFFHNTISWWQWISNISFTKQLSGWFSDWAFLLHLSARCPQSSSPVFVHTHSRWLFEINKIPVYFSDSVHACCTIHLKLILSYDLGGLSLVRTL